MTYIVRDVWLKILGKTDLLTCLNFSDIEAAEPFLTDPQAAMDIAIAANHRTGIRLLLRHGIGSLSADKAARHGHLDLLKWICHREEESDLDLDSGTVEITAANGHLHVLQWIFETFAWDCCDFTKVWLMHGYVSFKRAVENGHIDVARWLLSIRHQVPLHPYDAWTDWNFYYFYQSTSMYVPPWLQYIEGVILDSGRHPDVFRWLFTEARLELELDKLGPLGVSAALLHGSLEELKWLQTQYPSSFSAWSTIAWSPNSAAWSPTRSGSIMFDAISRGHMECVTLICALSTNEFVEDELRKLNEDHVFINYIRNNCDHDKTLAILQWLHERLGRSSCRFVAAAAATSCNFKLLQYLKDIDGEAFKENEPGELFNDAAWGGRLQVIQWLHQEELDHGTIEASAVAAANGHLEVLKWLHTNCPDMFCPDRMKDATSQSAAAGHLEVLKWLHQVRPADFSVSAMDRAAECGELDVVKWLHEHRQEGATTDAMDKALLGRHYDVAIWLQAHRSEGCSSEILEDCFRASRRNKVPYETYDFLKQYYPEKLNVRFETPYSNLEAWLTHSEQQFKKLHIRTI